MTADTESRRSQIAQAGAELAMAIRSAHTPMSDALARMAEALVALAVRLA